MRQIVRDYSALTPIEPTQLRPRGDSASPKGLIFHILENNAQEVSVLDIGFGEGSLGTLIKGHPQTRHWSVDGIDGLDANCLNPALIDKKLYRNIWHGLVQEMPSEQFRGYRIICLLDIIEHLSVDTAKWLLRSILTAMSDDANLFVSTPLWFYPQPPIQDGDLEEHLIGVPATSMMALIPVMYAISHPLVGGFVLTKKSLEFVEFFQPTPNKSFSYEQGVAIARAINLNLEPNVVYKSS